MSCTTALAVSISAGGQGASVRTDSILLARDLDGDGVTDYVVRQVRKQVKYPLSRDFRVAVYLDAVPGARRANWATPWYLEGEADLYLSEHMPLPGRQWLLRLYAAGGDGDSDWILVVGHGTVREEITHGVDYGQGYLQIGRVRDSVVVEASLARLELRHKQVTATVECMPTEWATMRLVFDPAKRRFTPQRTRCVSIDSVLKADGFSPYDSLGPNSRPPDAF